MSRGTGFSKYTAALTDVPFPVSVSQSISLIVAARRQRKRNRSDKRAGW
jgi:hypothetical protein